MKSNTMSDGMCPVLFSFTLFDGIVKSIKVIEHYNIAN
jgi:hypothetical protein